MTVEVGQIYEQSNGEIFVVSLIDEDNNVHLIYKDGYTASYSMQENSQFIFDKLLDTLPSWREAVSRFWDYDE